jgi:hypothetical protein
LYHNEKRDEVIRAEVVVLPEDDSNALTVQVRELREQLLSFLPDSPALNLND